MIFDLLINSFLCAPLKIVAFTTSRIYLMIYLIDITHIDKICDLVDQKFKFLCKLIGCEAQDYKIKILATFFLILELLYHELLYIPTKVHLSVILELAI